MRAAMLLATLFCAACGSDDDTPQPLTLADAAGSYAGTFDFTPSPSDLNPAPQPERGVAVELRIEEGRLCFDAFPTATLVRALVGAESAEGLLPLLGTVAYEAPIGAPTADVSQLQASLETPVLRLDVGGVLVVRITIEAPEKLRYTADGNLTCTLRTTLCQLGEGDEAGEPLPLVNELSFRVAKR